MARHQRAEIRMDEAEVTEFLRTSRTMTMATLGARGQPHLVAMWYGLVDGVVWFETKRKSQKVQNLRRDPRLTCLVEAGRTYEELRGVALEGTGAIVVDADVLWQVGISVFERYQGPFTDELHPILEAMLRNRVAVRVDVERVTSWDHRKLGMASTGPVGGTTAGEPS
jgi:PPOX class probable F420-dependent enzyme